MQLYDILLRLRGGGNELAKRNITAVEVYILQHLHQEGAQRAILKYRAVGAPIKRDPRLIKAEMVERYGEAVFNHVVGSGVGTKMPTTYTPPMEEEKVDAADDWSTVEQQAPMPE